MITLSPLMRLVMAGAGLAAFLVAFAVRDNAIERRGEEKALVKVERATNEVVSKAQSAGTRSKSGGGVFNPHYRD